MFGVTIVITVGATGVAGWDVASAAAEVQPGGSRAARLGCPWRATAAAGGETDLN